jgi:hypothetical protein
LFELFDCFADKAKAALVERADQGLFVPGVSDCSPRSIDPAAQGGFGDDPPIPNGIEDLVLADDAVAVLEEESQKVEDLWLDMHHCSAMTKFMPTKIQFVASESKHHHFERACYKDRL